MADPLEEAFDAEFGGGNTLLTQAQAEPDPEPTPEPAAEPQVAPEPEPEPEQLLAGKYKTPEDLEKAYKEIESRLGDKDFRELKDSYDQLAAQLQEIREAQQQKDTPPPFAEHQWPTEEVYSKPGRARATAIWLAQNQPDAFDDFVSEWAEYDTHAALDFKLEVAKAELRAEYEERLAPLHSVPERLETADKTAAAQQAFQNVWTRLQSTNPDLDEYGQRIVEEARSAPELAQVFSGADEAAIERTLNLYLNAARARRQQAQETAAALQAEETQAAKAKGTLTRATNTSQTTPQPPVDPLLEIFDRAIEGLSPWAAAQKHR